MTATSTSATFSRAAFRRKLRPWYERNGRHGLPWRLTRDPYSVLVSEVMLQQTQVERVLSYYHAWMARWPDFESLAAAPPSEVIREWRGLGYNRRALNLHRLASEVARGPAAGLPSAVIELRRLPGIGEYTASAIRSFAFEQRTAVADTNIARVAARTEFGVSHPRALPPARLRASLEALLPATGVRDHNLALMDLGALVCRARGPACDACPVQRMCAWKASGFPRSPTPAPVTPKFETTARFARGRLVDALREGPAALAELASILPSPHRERATGYLQSLEQEGLAARTEHGLWSLPAS